jgi:Icc-related predicted phosphoesterase
VFSFAGIRKHSAGPVNHFTTIGQLKLIIFGAVDIPPVEMLLLFGDTALDSDHKSLGDYGFTKNDTLKVQHVDPQGDMDDSEMYFGIPEERGVGFGRS